MNIPECRIADVGFRWDAERQHHVPQLVVEFEPVPANSPNDAKGWKDRDALAKLLAAAPPAPAAQASERDRLLALAKSRSGYEASAAAHHANNYPAFEYHTTRHAAMRDLIDAVFGIGTTGAQESEHD